MKRALIAAAIAVVASTLPGVALAQLRPEMQTGSMIPVQPKPLDTAHAGEVRKGMARCVYRVARLQTDNMLAHSDNQFVDLTAAKIKSITSYLALDSCLGGEMTDSQLSMGMRLTPGFLRDLLAEEAYLARNRTAPVLTSPTPALTVNYVSTGATLIQAQSMTAFTDCAVTKDLVNADALLRTMPGGAKELAAAKALAPVLGGCLPQGLQVKLNATSIRALVAFAMWTRFGQGAVK